MEWIWFTILAAFMQSVRTAGQKQLTNSLSAITSTWARYGFGLPLAGLYFFVIKQQSNTPLPAMQVDFVAYVVLAAISQLVATLLLVKVLSMRNFAAGTTYAKTEAIIAAALGALFFGVYLNALAWVAISIGIAGIVFVSIKKAHLSASGLLHGLTPVLGIGAGFCFAVTALSVRAASIVYEADPVTTAALILLLSIVLQGVLCGILVHWQSPDNWRQLAKQGKTSLFVGVTGTIGSIGWYTAFSYQEAAIVKSVGQIEYIFTVLLTYFFFKEKISRFEWVGIVLVGLSVGLLLRAA